jgi:hypothetical protein
MLALITVRPAIFRVKKMKRSACLMPLIAFLGAGCAASRAADKTPAPTEPRAGRGSSMSDESGMRDLFDRWERVWHEGQYDLVPSCVAENYIRHGEGGDRTVTREAYAAEIAKTRNERPDIRVVVYDHSFVGDRAWFRFAFNWHDSKTGEPRSRAGMQSLSDRSRQARGDLAGFAATGLGVDRCNFAGALDEPTAN